MTERISIKPKEFAKITGLSFGKVYRDIKEELIPSVRIGRSIEIPMWWVNKNYNEPNDQEDKSNK